MSEMGPDADLRGLCLVGPPSVLKIRWSMLADQPALCDAEVLQSELQCQAFARTDVARKKPYPARDDLVYTTHMVNGNELTRAEIKVPHVAPHGCAERGFFNEAGFTVAGREKELMCRPPNTAFGWLNSTRFVSP